MKRCEVKVHKKVCVLCKARRARFTYAGNVKWDRFHDCCGQCYRTNWDRMRAETRAQYFVPPSEPALHGVLIPSAEGTLTFFNEVAKDHQSLPEVQLVS